MNSNKRTDSVSWLFEHAPVGSSLVCQGRRTRTWTWSLPIACPLASDTCEFTRLTSFVPQHHLSCPFGIFRSSHLAKTNNYSRPLAPRVSLRRSLCEMGSKCLLTVYLRTTMATRDEEEMEVEAEFQNGRAELCGHLQPLNRVAFNLY